jgi:hypothetical protein
MKPLSVPASVRHQLMTGARGWSLPSAPAAPQLGVALSGAASPDMVIGDQTSTYILTPGGNPFSVDAGTTITTSTGDGIDGASGTAWTLTNAGHIYGQLIGVKLLSSSTLTNTGVIQGNLAAGVYIDGKASLTNSGAISSLHSSGVGLNGGGGTFANQAGGSVSGYFDGLDSFGLAALRITNSGTITGNNGFGINLASVGSSIVNYAAGTIDCSNGGAVELTTAGTSITNHGKISGGDGVELVGADTSVLNAAGGSISVSGSGVETEGKAASGAITNYGSVVGAIGVELAAGGTVRNENGGTINGVLAGVESGAGYNGATGVTINLVGGRIAGAIGIYAPEFSAAVSNAWRVTGTAGAGVRLLGGGAVANQAEAAITGATAGVYVTGKIGTVTNAGNITGDAGDGIALFAGGEATSFGGGTVTGQNGVNIEGAAGSVFNGGDITGNLAAGVVLGDGGVLTNWGHGNIDGQTFGVLVAAAPGSLRNAGTIKAANVAVQMNDGGGVANTAGASLYGRTGVYLTGATAAVSNNGQIYGFAGGGVVLADGGDVFNAKLGNITGVNGVHITHAFGSVINAGEIAALSESAVVFADGGTVENSLGGTISGQGFGVSIFGGKGTVTNVGAISASKYRSSGVSLGAGGSVTNAEGATISGDAYGVLLKQGGNLTNAGTIGFADAGVGGVGNIANTGTIEGEFGVVLNAGANLSNETGGTILGRYGGISEYGAGAMINAGTIHTEGPLSGGSGRFSGEVTVRMLNDPSAFKNLAGGVVSTSTYYRAVAVYLQNTGLDNAGNIQSGFRGVEFAGGAITNSAGGEITAAEQGIYVSGNLATTITNSGLISVNDGENHGFGIVVAPGTAAVTITNAATGLISAAEIGVSSEAVTTVTNAGQIAAGSSEISGDALYFLANATVTNETGGQITAIGDTGCGVAFNTGGTLINQTGGSIVGAAYGAILQSGAATQVGAIINAGTISGSIDSVDFRGGADTLTLQTGSTLIGNAVGGSSPTAKTSLILQGAGVADNNFLNFSALTMQGSGTWTLNGTSTFGAATVSSGALQVGDATHSGALTISGALVNKAAIEVVSGTFDIAGAVTGKGSAVIAGGTLEFGSSFTQNLDFTGTSGLLALADSQAYAGAITGFSLAGGTSLDLRDISFASGTTTATFVENGADAQGVLTVTDGTHTAHITLIGNYSGSTFTTSSDQNGGTIVVDPPKRAAAAHASVLPFIAAMASFDSGAGHWVPTANSGRSTPLLLAAARGPA